MYNNFEIEIKVAYGIIDKHLQDSRVMNIGEALIDELTRT